MVSRVSVYLASVCLISKRQQLLMSTSACFCQHNSNVREDYSKLSKKSQISPNHITVDQNLLCVIITEDSVIRFTSVPFSTLSLFTLCPIRFIVSTEPFQRHINQAATTLQTKTMTSRNEKCNTNLCLNPGDDHLYQKDNTHKI